MWNQTVCVKFHFKITLCDYPLTRRGILASVCLFHLILYIPVNNLSVMSRRVFLG